MPTTTRSTDPVERQKQFATASHKIGYFLHPSNVFRNDK